MFEEFKKQASNALEKTLKKKKLEKKITLEEQPIAEFGDASSRVCFELASTLKKSPTKIAEELAGEINFRNTLIKDVKPINGYINFYLDYKKLAPLVIEKVKNLKGEYGKGEKKRGKIIIEHTSANADGPLHIGHGRNAIIGDTLARIMRFSGYDVETQFYVNDMGKQLAIVVYGIGKIKLDRQKKKDLAIGEVYIKANKMLEENSEAEAEISRLMKAYENGEKKAVEAFEKAVNYCLEGIVETLKRMNVKHDVFVWESKFVRDSSVEKILEKLKKTEYAKFEDVLYLDLKKFGIEKELVLSRNDGTYLYTTRDIAYHVWKASKGDVIDVFGADHKLVAQQLGAVLEILGQPTPEFIIYEFISLPEGSMSTRRGTFISVDDLIEESVKRAHKEVEKRRKEESEEFKKSVSESVGIGAVRYNIVRVSPDKAMTFKWEDALDFEKQGSPFIQYAYARACRILEKAELAKKYEVPELTENEKLLVKTISKFSSAVSGSATVRRPSLIAAYALELADAFHRFYMFEPVLKSEKKDFRLNLVYATKITLENALNLLGIVPLEKM